MGIERILAGAVAVVINELDPVAIEGLAPVLLPGTVVDVVLKELLVGDGVGQIALFIGTSSGALGTNVHIAGDAVSCQNVVLNVVRHTEDALQNSQIGISDGLTGPDDLGVAHGVSRKRE